MFWDSVCTYFVLGQCLSLFCFGTVSVHILFWDSACTYFVLGQCLYIFCLLTVWKMSVFKMQFITSLVIISLKFWYSIILLTCFFKEKLQLWNRVHYKLGPNHKATSDRILSYQKTALKTCLTDIKTYIIISPCSSKIVYKCWQNLY